jgi:uncharacterized membrane protein
VDLPDRGGAAVSARPTADDRRPIIPFVTRHSSFVTPARLLALGILCYIAIFTLAAWYKYDAYQMGFDLGVHQQVLWNTAHGRIAATSAFADTESYLGVDIIPTELLLAPIYALAPSIYTMLFLQTLALGLGALPVFLIVRDRFARLQIADRRLQIDRANLQSTICNLKFSEWAGLVFAAAFLLYLPVEYMNLYEFQIRAFATTFLLMALLALERRRFWPFLIWSLLALGCRSDVGFVVAGMGLTQWRMKKVEGRREQTNEQPSHSSFSILHSSFLKFGALPIVLGLGWVGLCMVVLIPLFRTSPFLYTQIIYGQFGDSVGEIARTIITRPGYVAAYVFGGPNGAARLRYLLEMFLPFGFLLLLQPRMLLITLPIFGLNLLSNTPNIHASTHYHYQALIIPFMVVGSAYGLHWLIRRATDDGRRRSVVGSRWSLVGVLALALLCNLVIFTPFGSRNPVVSLAGAALRPSGERARLAAAERLLAQVPPDAALATTNKIGPHASRRERIFFFPGNVIYPEEKVAQAQYLLIDQVELLQDEKTRAERQRLLADLQASGRYRHLDEEQGISLWQRAGP